MSKIVVGIDGSFESKHALRWAAREAKLRGAQLWVVIAWSVPFVATAPNINPVLDGEATGGVRQWAEVLVEREVEEAGDAVAGLDVSKLAVEGAPVEALLDASVGADMLVVGTRGRGKLVEARPGSVSHQCAQRARCPVVVVPRDSGL